MATEAAIAKVAELNEQIIRHPNEPVVGISRKWVPTHSQENRLVSEYALATRYYFTFPETSGARIKIAEDDTFIMMATKRFTVQDAENHPYSLSTPRPYHILVQEGLMSFAYHRPNDLVTLAEIPNHMILPIFAEPSLQLLVGSAALRNYLRPKQERGGVNESYIARCYRILAKLGFQPWEELDSSMIEVALAQIHSDERNVLEAIVRDAGDFMPDVIFPPDDAAEVPSSPVLASSLTGLKTNLQDAVDLDLDKSNGSIRFRISTGDQLDINVAEYIKRQQQRVKEKETNR